MSPRQRAQQETPATGGGRLRAILFESNWGGAGMISRMPSNCLITRTGWKSSADEIFPAQSLRRELWALGAVSQRRGAPVDVPPTTRR